MSIVYCYVHNEPVFAIIVELKTTNIQVHCVLIVFLYIL